MALPKRFQARSSIAMAFALAMAISPQLWAAPSNEERACLLRYAQTRSHLPAGQGVRPGTYNDDQVLSFCHSSPPVEGVDCVFGFMAQGGVFSKNTNNSIYICQNGYDGYRDCVADLMKRGVVVYMLEALETCQIRDPERRQCTIDRYLAVHSPGAAPSWDTDKVCERQGAGVRSCLFDFLDGKPPFNTHVLKDFDSAVEACEFIDRADPASRECGLDFLLRKPPFQDGMITTSNQARILCSIPDPQKRLSVLEQIRSGTKGIRPEDITSFDGYHREDAACHAKLAGSWFKGSLFSPAPTGAAAARLVDMIEEICGISNAYIRECAMDLVNDPQYNRPGYLDYKAACLLKAASELLKARANVKKPG